MKNDKKEQKYNKKEYFVNRELSWLEFNERVLHEANDDTIPLMERPKFLSITASNLDEFFMVRVASLKDMLHAGYKGIDIAGMSAKEQLEKISIRTHRFVEDQYKTYDKLLPLLKEKGLRIIKNHEELSKEEGEYVDKYFETEVYPVVTPMAVDSSRPFPLVRNKTLNIAALLKRKNSAKPLIALKEKKHDNKIESLPSMDAIPNDVISHTEYDMKSSSARDDMDLDFALVQVPSVIPRVVKLPHKGDNKAEVILLEQIIERNMDKLFLNYDIVAAYPFRIMRNAEFELDEEDAADLLEEIEKQLKKRQRGEAIRLEIEKGVDERLLNILTEELGTDEEDLFMIDGPLDLTFCMKLFGLDGFDDLKLVQHVPAKVPELINDDDIFTNIRKQDILLLHPYETFDPVVEFVQKSARDPKVLAIKQTLYRVSGHSPIIQALAEAADNGKQVTVLVELKARFDEENNIIWAKMLERAGCHVIYGLVGLKTHSKITLVVRDEDDGIRRYVHLATGNYNDSTAKLYTDIGLFTCDRDIGEDATAVFNMLSGYSEPLTWNKLIIAPLWMKDRFLSMIGRCKKAARDGKNARIVAKMNSLSDKDIIEALYEASAAGVKIELIVRGICCLKVGIKGVSDNISVRSIVGNYLEHARIFYFDIDGEEEYYLGSADWMPRNLEKRVEIVFPVTDERLRDKLYHYLELELSDNIKASIYQPDGSYVKIRDKDDDKINSQDIFCKEIDKEVKEIEKTSDRSKSTRTFIQLKNS